MAHNSPSKMLKFRNLLWKLHYKLEKTGTSHTSFERLNNDPHYRARILDFMMKQDDDDLSDLAAKIIEQEILLGIHYQLDEDEASSLSLNTQTALSQKSPRRKSWFSSAALSLLVLLIAFVGYSTSSLNINAIPSMVAESNAATGNDDKANTAVAINENSPPQQNGDAVVLDDKKITATEIKENNLAITVAPAPVEQDESSQIKQTEPEPIIANTLFRIHGSNTVGEKLAPQLIEAYLRQIGAQEITTINHSDVEKSVQAFLDEKGWVDIEIHAHGSSTAFKDLNNGHADMGMSSRQIKDKEVTLLQDRFGILSRSVSEHVIGLDGLAVIINKANQINDLNTEQLSALFSGEITNWSQVGGDDLPVTVYARDINSGTWDTFKNLVLKKHGKQLLSRASRHESSSELSDLVSEDIGAIGFIGLPYVRHAKLLAVADDIDAQSIIPTLFTVGTEDYPLSRRLYFYTPEKQSVMMRDFIEFTHSNTGQEIVKNIGFISQNIYTVNPAIKPGAPADYQQFVTTSERLSLNFRFHTGSDQLDNKSLRDINRLTQYLEKNPDKELSLFGFSDSIGTEYANLKLSESRAKKVEYELQKRGVYPVRTKGFGEIMPVASNTTKAGRNKNRRVEIWVQG